MRNWKRTARTWYRNRRSRGDYIRGPLKILPSKIEMSHPISKKRSRSSFRITYVECYESGATSHNKTGELVYDCHKRKFARDTRAFHKRGSRLLSTAAGLGEFASVLSGSGLPTYDFRKYPPKNKRSVQLLPPHPINVAELSNLDRLCGFDREKKVLEILNFPLAELVIYAGLWGEILGLKGTKFFC